MALTSSERTGLRLLAAATPRARLALVLGLSVAGSVTEGLGLMLLVPMLGLIGAGAVGAAGGRVQELWEWLAAAGLPTSLSGLLGLFVALVTLRAALVQGRVYAEQALQLRVVENLRRQLLAALLQANWSWLARHSQAQLMGVLLGTIDRVGLGLQQVQMLAAALATLAMMFVAALLIDPLPALALSLGGLLVMAVHMMVRRKSRRIGEALDQGYADYFGFFTERLANLRLIKSFATEERDLEAVDAVAGAMRGARLAFVSGLNLGQFALQAGTAAVLGITVWLAVTRWGSSPVTLLPLIAVSARAAPLLAALQAGFQNVAHDLPALAELGRSWSEAAAAAEPADGSLPPPRLRRELALKSVTVRHPGRDLPALDAVSLRVAKGSTILLSGPSGAGKSTLADVLGGLIAPDGGRLVIDGTEVGEARRRAWRGQVAYVQQEPVLFHASIRENLLWACPAADPARLEQALRDASAEFVFGLPQGIETVVGDRGSRLSGGERQRIALARGLLRSPDLLILDEVTSALDAANDAAVAGVIAELKGRMTIVMIGHRGALAALADRTIVLEAGRIAGDDAG